MRILVDENIPLVTVQTLRHTGHDVLDIRGTPDEGMPDDVLWRTAQREKRLLVTTDKGFARHRNERHSGLLIVRLQQPNRFKIHRRVMEAMGRFGPARWPGLMVVMRDRVQSVWKARPGGRA